MNNTIHSNLEYCFPFHPFEFQLPNYYNNNLSQMIKKLGLITVEI